MAQSTSTKKRLSPTVTYLMSALAFGFPTTVSVSASLPSWRNGLSLSPESLAAIHITVLGFMLTVMFGVLYQIVPIAFQAPPLPRHVLIWHLPIHLISVTGMAYGFTQTSYTLVAVFGSMLGADTLLYFLYVGHSYGKARNQTAVHKQLAWPVLSLCGVIGIGLFQAFVPSRTTPHVVLSHVLLGGLGFWGGLLLVVSYKLIPMFALSHGYKSRLPLVAGFYFGAIGLDLLGQILNTGLLKTIGLLGTSVALVGFSADVIRILAARKRKRIVLPLKQAIVALGISLVGEFWLLFAWALGNLQGGIVAAFLFIFAGVLPMMLAYMQKIVPFLWFEYRFSKSRDRKQAPLIDDMVPRRPAAAGFLIYYVGSLSGLTYLLLPNNTKGTALNMAEIGFALCLFSSFVLFLYAFTKVVRLGGQRPANDMTTRNGK